MELNLREKNDMHYDKLCNYFISKTMIMTHIMVMIITIIFYLHLVYRLSSSPLGDGGLSCCGGNDADVLPILHPIGPMWWLWHVIHHWLYIVLLLLCHVLRVLCHALQPPSGGEGAHRCRPSQSTYPPASPYVRWSPLAAPAHLQS